MEDIVKQVIVGGITIAAIGGFIGTGGGIVSLDGQIMTKGQYEDLRTTLTNKYLLKQDFTINEYFIFTKVLDKEAKENKFKDIKNITETTLLPKMVDKVIK